MKTIGVRACRRDDVPALAALGRAAFLETYAGTADTDDLARHVEDYFSEAAIAKEIVRESVRYFMAESGEVCAGMIKLRLGSRQELVPEGESREVQQLYVSADYQRKGVGRRLMDAAVAHSQEAAASGLFLSVWSQANWAIAFYEDYGFRALGDVPFRLGSTEYIDRLMWLALAGDERSSR